MFLQVILITDNEDFDLELDDKLFSYIRFTTTLDKIFSSEFIKLQIEKKFIMKSIETFSELSGMSLTISEESELLLTLSRSLDQSTGLDASKELVDSAVFDSSNRLLKFDLIELSTQKKRLERIQRNSRALSRPEYSCEFVAIVEMAHVPSFMDTLSKLKINLVTQDDSLRPKVIIKSIETFYWPVNEEFDVKDRHEILDLLDWIGVSLNLKNSDILSKIYLDCFKVGNCMKYICIEGSLLPSSHLLKRLQSLLTSSTRTIFSLKLCKGIPPAFELNALRLKQFNERKFDPTACTADQQALTIFKSPSQTLSLRLNIN